MQILLLLFVFYLKSIYALQKMVSSQICHWKNAGEDIDSVQFFFFFFCPIKNPVAPIPVTEIQYLNVIGLAVLTGFLELQRILNLVYAEFQGDSWG